jgi:hypothetical protein
MQVTKCDIKITAIHVKVGTTEGFECRLYDLHIVTITTFGAISLSRKFCGIFIERNGSGRHTYSG